MTCFWGHVSDLFAMFIMPGLADSERPKSAFGASAGDFFSWAGWGGVGYSAQEYRHPPVAIHPGDPSRS